MEEKNFTNDVQNAPEETSMLNTPVSEATQTLPDNEATQTASDNEANDDLPVDEDGEPIYNSDWLKRNTSVHGWLTFFLFAITLGGIVSAAYPIFTLNLAEYSGSYFLAACDIMEGLFLCALALYTVYAFDRRKPNAVFCARCYVIMVFATNAISLFVGGVDDTALLGSSKQLIRSLMWCVIWFLYTVYSEQVEEIIPKSFRKVTWRDWAFVGTPFALWTASFFLGFYMLTKDAQKHEAAEAEMMTVTLQDKERTDGRIIFTVPDSCTCKQEVEDGAITFTLSSGPDSNGMLLSDYETDFSDDQVEMYWKSAEDQSLRSHKDGTSTTDTKTYNGNKCIHKYTHYSYYGSPIDYDFYMLCSESTGKCAFLFFYGSDNSQSCAEEILQSIRFEK